MQTYATMIKVARQSKNLYMVHLAQACGVGKYVIQGWESGAYVPSIEHTAALLRLLDLDATFIAACDEARAAKNEPKQAQPLCGECRQWTREKERTRNGHLLYGYCAVLGMRTERCARCRKDGAI